MSLWALGASTFILGTDLTNLDPTDLSYLRNRAVISVDQDGIDATRIVDTDTEQVFAKTERDDDAVVGLFNTSSQPEVVAATGERDRTAASAPLPAKKPVDPRANREHGHHQRRKFRRTAWRCSG
jgi:hypothetical protein